MTRSARVIAGFAAAIAAMAWGGCEDISSNPPSHFSSPVHMALGGNPLETGKEILYTANPFTGLTADAGLFPTNGTIVLVDLPAETIRPRTVPLGGLIQDIAVSADGRALYASLIQDNGAGRMVSATTGAALSVTAALTVTGTIGRVVTSGTGDAIFVFTSGPDALLLVSPTTFTEAARASLAFTPGVAGVSPTGAIVVGNPGAGTVEIIRPGAFAWDFSGTSLSTQSVSLPGRPTGISFSPDGSTAYVAVANPGAVVAVDLSGASPTPASVSIGGIPSGIATSLTSGTLVFVANENGIVYSVNFSTNSVDRSLFTGGDLHDIVLTGTRGYIANSYNYSITVIDTATMTNVKIMQ